MEPERELVRAPEQPPVELLWTCLGCALRWTLPMPGYPGNGRTHYVHHGAGGECGPLIAIRKP